MAVECGGDRTDVTGVFEGYTLPNSIRNRHYNGNMVTDFLMKVLGEKGYSFTTVAEREIIRDMKEKLCYVALDFEEEHNKDPVTLEAKYELPDGQIITIDKERIRCPETYFKPQFLGLSLPGIHHTIYEVILKSSIDIRNQLYSNIILSGASIFPNMDQRIQQEINQWLAPPGTAVKVTVIPNNDIAVWKRWCYIC